MGWKTARSDTALSTDARNDPTARFDNPTYYVGKPRADLRKTVLCTGLSVLAKSAAALLVSRHLEELPES